MRSPRGSSFLIARKAVGAVNRTFTSCWDATSPKRARVRRPDRLALVENGGGALEQRRVYDVGMTDYPSDVRRGPEDLAGADSVDCLHAPSEGDGVAAIIADDALRNPGRARGVQDVERIGRFNRDAVDCCS